MISLFSGYLYIGQYLNSNYIDLEDRQVKYRSGIHLEFKPTEKTTLFIEDETLIDRFNQSFHPSQINYTIGISHKIGQIEILGKHECRHSIDSLAGELNKQEYNLIELRFYFN